jgi:hypothetical protein
MMNKKMTNLEKLQRIKEETGHMERELQIKERESW